MSLRDVSPKELLSRLAQSDSPLAVVFWSPAERTAVHARESLETFLAHSGIPIDGVAVDIAVHPDATRHWPVTDVPTLLLFSGAVLKQCHEGPLSAGQLKRLVGQAFPDIAAPRRRRSATRPAAPRPPLRGRDGQPVLPTPRQMRDHLDRYIRGQSKAKRDVATAIYNHYLAQADRDAHGGEPRSHHILLLGPTGCGKTFIVRTVAEMLDIPFVITSATGLVEAGYRGRSPDSIVKSLLDRAKGDPRLAEKGIIFIDEIDKIRGQDCGGSRDVSGEGVQNALLTLIGGTTADNVDGHVHSAVDTSKVLFVCTGAFVGLPDIVRRRLGSGRSAIGFRSSDTERHADIPDHPIYESLCQAQTADLVAYGMIPEFIGRFTTVTALHELGVADLRRIITAGTEESPLFHYRRLAEIHGIDLVFEDEALDAIALEAKNLGTGARGLKRLISRVMDGVDDSWPELADSGVTRVVIDREVVISGKEPRCVKGKRVLPRCDLELRAHCLQKASARPPVPAARPLVVPPSLLDIEIGKNDAETRKRLDRLVERELGWSNASGSERLWWQEVVERTTVGGALSIAQALRSRGASISEAFGAYVKSGSDDIAAVIHYLDFLRARAGDDERKKRPGRDPLDDLHDDVPF